jgi:hypothetical protein
MRCAVEQYNVLDISHLQSLIINVLVSCFIFKKNSLFLILQHSWLRHYATSWKVACSILDEVTGYFNLPNPSSCTIALGPTLFLAEMNTRILPEGKGWPVRKGNSLTGICELTV